MNNKFDIYNNASKKSQKMSVQLAQVNQEKQGKFNDNASSADEVITEKQIELDNPNFVLGYN